jgi:predicted permease
VLTLALGIGANAAVFDVLDRLLLRPPAHVMDADRVVRLYLTTTSSFFGTYTSPVTGYEVFRDLRDAGPFENLAAFHEGEVSVGRGVEAEKARAALVSHSYFSLLGVSPAAGRFFAAEEDRVTAEPVAVLSHGYWRRTFAADPGVLGRQLWVGKDAYTVVGIAPRGFTGVNVDNVDLWLPIERASELVFGHDVVSGDAARGSVWLQMIARLPAAQVRDVAEGRATAVYNATLAERPGPVSSTGTVGLGPIQQARGPNPDQTVEVSRWLAAVAAIVLLIACANAANLMLTAAVGRRPEIAVRLALGGGRTRLLRLLFLEHLCLALVAGAVALLVAMWTGPLLRTFLLPRLPESDGILDLRVFIVTVAATLAASVLAGLVPAWQGSRVDLVSTLKTESRGGARRSYVRSGLLLTQVALTLTLLAGAGLFVRSLQKVRALDIGVDAERVLVGTMDLREGGHTTNELNALYLRMLDRIARLPGVERVSASVFHPFGMHSAMTLKVPGRDSLPQLPMGGPYYSVVLPGYFETIGTEIVRGRGFTAADGRGSPWVVILSETWARLIWPAANPLGQCVTLGDQPQCYQVVGIAEDVVRFQAVEEPHMHFYIPMGQWTDRGITGLFVRPRGDPEALIPAVRREMQSVESDLPFANVLLLQDRVDPSIRPWRLGATLFTAFGLLALAVATIGLYGVLSYLVSQRTHEIGVRMALGADVGSVLRLIVGDGVRMTLAGLVLGLAGAFAAGRALKALLYGVSPADPTTIVIVTVALLAAAALASYLPARRAAKVDPMVALRYE